MWLQMPLIFSSGETKVIFLTFAVVFVSNFPYFLFDNKKLVLIAKHHDFGSWKC